MKRRFYTLVIFMIVSVFPVVLSEDDDCFNLVQSLHTLEFDKKSADDNILRISGEIERLRSEESPEEIELSDQSNALAKLSREGQLESTSASNAQIKLKEAENKTALISKNLTESRSNLHHLSYQRTALQMRLQSLHSQAEVMDDTRHKDELKLQMLKSDLSAGIQTLRDSELTVQKRTDKAKRLMSRVGQLLNDQTNAQKWLQSSNSEYQVILSQLDRLKQERTDTQGVFISGTQEEESIRHNVEHDRQIIDSDKIDISTSNRSYETFETGVLAGIKSHLAALRREKMNVSGQLNASGAEVTRLNTTLKSSIQVPIDSAVSPASLRESLRESRLFLAKQGYKDPLSLLQSGDWSPERVNTEVQLFKETSKKLALEKKKDDLDSEITSVQSELDSAIGREKRMLEEIYEKQKKQDDEIKSLDSDLVKLNHSQKYLASVKKHVVDLDSQIQEEASVGDKMKNALEEKEKEFNSLESIIRSLNKTLESVQRDLHDAAADHEFHSVQVLQLNKDISTTEKELRELDSNMTRASYEIRINQENSTQLAEVIQNTTKQIDSTEREHTEFMADIAQISRRIEEKVDTISEIEGNKKSLQDSVRKLEYSIRQRLNKLSEMNTNLSQEIQVRDGFVRRINDTKSRLNAMRCHA